jgi:type III restriction enzyme
MLHDDFDAFKKFQGSKFFTDYIEKHSELVTNLNPKVSLRTYQKEALGRFIYYFEDFIARKNPIHLMFNMATGSGKTLIMAANMLYLYKKGYRNFIFFTRLENIVGKTKSNFLSAYSSKYLFSDSIDIEGKKVRIREVLNFESSIQDDINIIFTTTSGLHSRFINAKENSLTFEDFANTKMVLIADEAHNLSADVATKPNQSQELDRRSWGQTVERILNTNQENILMEFTATARLEEEYPEILAKYKDKAIYKYDLKEFRLDGYSKDVRTLQVDSTILDRCLVAIVISQYRRKLAEKHGLALKPVVLFKSNRVTAPKDYGFLEENAQIVVSSVFKAEFSQFVSNLADSDLVRIENTKSSVLEKAFKFFREEGTSLHDLVNELKFDFADERCLSVDENDALGNHQELLNSLEDKDNEIRAIFATDKLNEGWDVLNLFDIVRLYDSRDSRNNKAGATTVQEAQLIGRGARYYPFKIDHSDSEFQRKYDSDTQNDLRILEQLYYHSKTNPRYIQELEGVLVKDGIMPSSTVEKHLSIKPEIKKSKLWTEGVIYVNSRVPFTEQQSSSIHPVEVLFDTYLEENLYKLQSGASEDRSVFEGNAVSSAQVKTKVAHFEIREFGEPLLRFALSRTKYGNFTKLSSIFKEIRSVRDFVLNPIYLGGVKVAVLGSEESVSNLSTNGKLAVVDFVLSRIFDSADVPEKRFFGSLEFHAVPISDVFSESKILNLDGDSPRAQSMKDFDFVSKEWFAQNEIWGTSEEEALLRFIDSAMDELLKSYSSVLLLRNEAYFRIYNFSDGEAFYPDFVLFLVDKDGANETVKQIFIEPKGNQFLDSNHTFESSKEGWKQKLLLDLAGKYELSLIFEDADYRLMGMPFFNSGTQNIELRNVFQHFWDNEVLDVSN